jgi:hypothetical protein
MIFFVRFRNLIVQFEKSTSDGHDRFIMEVRMNKKDYAHLTVYLGTVRLNGEQAYITARMLESLIRALWYAHGDAMADFQGRAFPDDDCCYSSLYGPLPDDDDCGPNDIPF